MRIKELLEKLQQISMTRPSDSARTLNTYGWDHVPDTNKFTHDHFPGHSMHVTSDSVRHTHHGIGTNIPHDDFPKYVRGLHNEKSGYKDHDWDAGEGEDD